MINTLSIILSAFIVTQPTCVPEVRYTDLPDNILGQYHYITGSVIYLDNDLPADQYEWVYQHELGHCVFLLHEKKIRDAKLFGFEPFVSDYAKTNPAEDFAETYAYINNSTYIDPQFYEKVRFIQSL